MVQVILRYYGKTDIVEIMLLRLTSNRVWVIILDRTHPVHGFLGSGAKGAQQ